MRTLSYQEVARVADALHHRGDKPGLEDVCEVLKCYDNDAEILEHLEQWYHNQPEFQRSFDPDKYVDESIEFSWAQAQEHQKLVEAHQEAQHALSLAQATLESTADGILIINKSGEVTDWNQKFVDMWRLPVGLLEAGPEGPGFSYVLDQVVDPEGLVKEVTRLYDNPNEQGNIGEVHFLDGRVFQRYSQPHRVNDEIVGRVWSFRDITSIRKNEAKLKLRELAIETSPLGVILFTAEEGKPKVTYVNPAFTRITGFEWKDIVGDDFKMIFAKDKDKHQINRLMDGIKGRRELDVQIACRTKNEKLFDAEIKLAPSQTEESVFVTIVSDITDKLNYEKQLIQQATHDNLTGLPNRSLLVDRVEQEINHHQHDNERFALLFLDLDRFKMINDSLGHSVGDKLLKIAAARFTARAGKLDTVARIGGDEFVFILPNVGDKQNGIEQAKKILEVFDQEFIVDNHRIELTASVGVSYYPDDGSDYETLLKNSDLSMYSAKAKGRNHIKMFEREMQESIDKRFKFESLLRSALDRDEFSLVYQPILDIKTNKPIGAECLLRWNNPEVGPQGPLTFVPMLEDTGGIIEVGDWVIEHGFSELQSLRQRGFDDFKMALNISPMQFSHGNLVKTVKKYLDKYQIPANRVELEITESLLIDDVAATTAICQDLRDIGITIAIDDFGTGYSSLSYLKRFPINTLKIDQIFVMDMFTNENNLALVNAILHLADAMSLDVVAEGVCEQQHHDFFVQHQCHYAQGYHYSKPVVLEELEKYMQNML